MKRLWVGLCLVVLTGCYGGSIIRPRPIDQVTASNNQEDLAILKATRNCPYCVLLEANLSGADLSDAGLCRANLFGANLSGANLTGADLRGANLIKTNLSGADLSGANLSQVNLTHANLSGTVLKDVFYCNTLMPDGTIENAECPSEGSSWDNFGDSTECQ